MQKRPLLWVTLFMLVCLSLSTLLAACGGESATRTNPTATPIYEPVRDKNGDPVTPGGTTSTGPTTNATAPSTAAAAPTSSSSSSSSSTTGTAASTTAAAATTAAATTAAAAPASDSSAGGSSASNPAPAATPGSSYSKPNQPVYNQQPLKAGAVDDNVNFTEYMQYLQGYRNQDVLPLDVSERYIINVVDGNGRTVSNATVKIYTNQTLIFQGKTYSNGQVLFFPRTLPSAAQVTTFDVTAEKDGQTLTRSFQRQDQNQGYNQNQFIGANWTLNLNGSFRNQQNASTTLDLLFLLDSTGSMGGEIRRIQQTISDIAYQITALPGQPRLRFGIVTYRDRGDTYITRKYGFTENLGDFSSFLNSISAGGGGDYPESLNEGLHVAVNEMNWSNGDALRLAFLVADAPPHLDYPNDYKYTNELVDAVRQGIKVYTIGASGLTPPGEYVFRQLAETTLAQYIFITRGGDENRPGSGGPASNTGIAYNEQTLDQIVVGIVRQELNNLTQ